MTHNKRPPYALKIKRYEDTTYFITSLDELQQLLRLMLGEIEPSQCVWSVHPMKLDWKKYRPTVMGTGDTMFFVTSQKEFEQVLGVAGGDAEGQNYDWTIPPIPQTAS